MGSLREHLQAANPQDPRLKQVELETDEIYYAWVFNQLGRSREYDNGFPASLTLASFKDYMSLFDDELHFDEILLLEEMDDAFVSAMIKNRSD